MKYFLTILAVAMMLASCQREPMEVIVYEPPVINPPNDPVTGNLVGSVFTDDQNAIADAIITSHGRQTTTDANGRFSFENVNMYADGTYVTVEKPGFHLSSRKLYAIEGETNVVSLKMIKLNHDNSFNSSSDETIEVENIELQIAPSNYLLSGDETYDGEVMADIFCIPIGSSNNHFVLPGDLTGLDGQLQLKAIQNYGVFNFDITSQTGQALKFPNDHNAIFNYKLSDIELSGDLNDLMVWYFDDINGTWLAKGEAIVANGVISGEIDQAGFWMIGKAYDYAEVKGSLVDVNSLFPNTRLDIQNDDMTYLSTLNTTISGMFLTRVPKSLELEMSIFHKCHVESQVEELGSLIEDTNFDAIQIEAAMDNIEIQGHISDCNGTDSTMPYLKINIGDDQYMYRSDAMRNFDFSFTNCDETEVSIIAIDDETSKVSDVHVLPIDNVIEVGNIQTCEEIESGYAIDYSNMNWSQNLATNVNHQWTVSRVTAIEDKIIFSAKMIDQETGALYLNAAFVFVEGESEAEYQVSFKTQGFAINGLCQLDVVEHQSITTYRFVGLNTEIAETDTLLYPSGGVDEVNFNLVYYD